MDEKEARELYFGIQDLGSVALTFVVVALILGVGTVILTNYKGTLTGENTTAAEAVIDDGVDNMTAISDQTGTIIVVVLAAIMLGIVLAYFKFR